MVEEHDAITRLLLNGGLLTIEFKFHLRLGYSCIRRVGPLTASGSHVSKFGPNGKYLLRGRASTGWALAGDQIKKRVR